MVRAEGLFALWAAFEDRWPKIEDRRLRIQDLRCCPNRHLLLSTTFYPLSSINAPPSVSSKPSHRLMHLPRRAMSRLYGPVHVALPTGGVLAGKMNPTFSVGNLRSYCRDLSRSKKCVSAACPRILLPPFHITA